MKRIPLEKYVVTNGFDSLDYDSASGGYPWCKTRDPIGCIFPNIEAAVDRGLPDSASDYVRMTGAKVFRLVLEEVETDEAIANVRRRQAEEELARIKNNIKRLRPEDIEYIKNNM